MTAFATRMTLDWIESEEIPASDLQEILDRIYARVPSLKPAPITLPATVVAGYPPLSAGRRARIKDVSPKYLTGIEGVLGKEPGQSARRYALYLDPAAIATVDKRAVRFIQNTINSHSRARQKYIPVTLNMLEPA